MASSHRPQAAALKCLLHWGRKVRSAGWEAGANKSNVHRRLHQPLRSVRFDAVIADKGYDSDPLRALLEAKQVEVVIPSRRDRKQQREYDRLRYTERNIVERFINIIKWYRRIFTRYEKLARRFMAFLHLAATLIWLRRNVNDS